MKKISTVISVVSFIFLPVMGIADVLSQQSQNYSQGKTDIDVGKTQYEGGGGTNEGNPGLGYRFVTEGITISFSELKDKATKAANGIYIIDKAEGYHGSIGRFNFSQVADAEIYYGDWSQTGDIVDSKHTAFYSGKEIGNDIPTEGQASYTISGVNQYESSSKMPGTFLADFGQKTYEGTLDGQLANIKFSGEIGEDGKFSGVALANDQADGISTGQLFGQDAAQVAGMVSFPENHQYDTAFGGVKN
ncbi:Slam-dependent surface lipoprotein [Providencia vermicola]|uniref:Slam-dependent surface lipoprotein n=1 Tax=Providencia vermicola TaxID=333965 RepID=UPI0021FE846D|nr:transferrin-binding protein-like solute binding protein [Providencia stuartii]